MIARMLAAQYSGVRLVHVRMAFSRDFAEMKRFQLRKLLELLRVVGAIAAARFRYGATVLYYPPAGPDIMPVLRDIAVLGLTRWLFHRTIFHFHAGGLSAIYPQLNRFLRWAFRKAFEVPDIAVRLSRASPEDGRALRARREFIVPNGVDDMWTPDCAHRRDGTTVLYVGMLSEAKGLLVLIDAMHELIASGVACRLQLMGRFASAQAESALRARIGQARLESSVHFLGELLGEQKWAAFARASMFCFPSHYESESFPVAVIEAMSFALPVVATRWRGIPELVVDGETGYLVEPHNSVEVALRLSELARDEAKRVRLGAAGRARYLQRYTTSCYIEGLQDVFTAALCEGK